MRAIATDIARNVVGVLNTWVGCAERLDRSRCRLVADSCWSKEPCITWGGKDWRQLANAIGRSVLGGDAGFRQITLLRVARDNHRFSSVTE